MDVTLEKSDFEYITHRSLRYKAVSDSEPNSAQYRASLYIHLHGQQSPEDGECTVNRSNVPLLAMSKLVTGPETQLN